jgi:hypothetical protein
MTNLEEEKKKITRGKMSEPNKPLELICATPTPAQAWRTLRTAMRDVDLGRLIIAARAHAWCTSMHVLKLELELAGGPPPQNCPPFSIHTYTPEIYGKDDYPMLDPRYAVPIHWPKPYKTYSRNMFIAAMMYAATMFDAANVEPDMRPAVFELQRICEHITKHITSACEKL